jgi:hypothetical protein
MSHCLCYKVNNLRSIVGLILVARVLANFIVDCTRPFKCTSLVRVTQTTSCPLQSVFIEILIVTFTELRLHHRVKVLTCHLSAQVIGMNECSSPLQVNCVSTCSPSLHVIFISDRRSPFSRKFRLLDRISPFAPEKVRLRINRHCAFNVDARHSLVEAEQ